MIALEQLLTTLGITQYMAALSDWRDDLIRNHAAELQGLHIAKDAEREAAVKAAVDAIIPPEPATPPLISALHAAFTSTLPPEAQVAFAAPYAIVRTLVQADQMQLAADYIASVPVPPELEAAKAALIALIVPVPSLAS